MGCGETRLKIHHRRSALLRQSERSGPNVEQWLTDLHLLGHYRRLHSGAALNHLHETQRNRQDSSYCRTGSAERSIKTSFIFIKLYKFTKWFDCRINRHWCQSILKGHFVFLFDVVMNNVCRLHPACNRYRSIQSNWSFVVDTFVKMSSGSSGNIQKWGNLLDDTGQIQYFLRGFHYI